MPCHFPRRDQTFRHSPRWKGTNPERRLRHQMGHVEWQRQFRGEFSGSDCEVPKKTPGNHRQLSQEVLQDWEGENELPWKTVSPSAPFVKNLYRIGVYGFCEGSTFPSSRQVLLLLRHSLGGNFAECPLREIRIQRIKVWIEGKGSVQIGDGRRILAEFGIDHSTVEK